MLKDESTRRIYDAHRAQTSSEYTRQSYGSHDYRRAWGAHSRNDDPFKMRHEWPYRYDDYVKKVSLIVTHCSHISCLSYVLANLIIANALH